MRTKFWMLKIIVSLGVWMTMGMSDAIAYSGGEVVSRMNEARANAGLVGLSVNGKLQSAAEMKLGDIRSYKYWAHNNPSTGASWVSFVRASGFGGAAGENLARNFGSIDGVIGGWLNSPDHRANLLNGSFDSVGIVIGDVDYDSGSEVVVVAIFGATGGRAKEPEIKVVVEQKKEILVTENQKQDGQIKSNQLGKQVTDLSKKNKKVEVEKKTECKIIEEKFANGWWYQKLMFIDDCQKLTKTLLGYLEIGWKLI